MAFLYLSRLFLAGCAYGTCFCTGTAANALVSVDLVLIVSFGNATYGTCGSACAACDAVVTDYVCH